MRAIKPKEHEGMTESPSKMSHEKMYPKFRIELDHLPEAKKWKIGDEYTIALKLKMTGISISRFQNDSEFDIVGIDPEYKESE